MRIHLNKKLKAQKGTSLIVVFIVCTVIGILLATTFFVTGNYGIAIVSRKAKLRELVCPACVQEVTDTSSEDGAQ